MKINVQIVLIASFALSCHPLFALAELHKKDRAFYVGVITGYADVDWGPVISTDKATRPTNPTNAEGTGGMFGVDLGYQFSPYVQVEAQYIRMPTSTLTYAPISHRDYGPLNSTSTMDFWAIVAKFMVPIGNTGLSLLTEAGPAYQLRQDNVADVATWTPTFGGGLSYQVNRDIQVEAVFQYAAGTGKSEADPMDDYVPEIYAYTIKVNYLF